MLNKFRSSGRSKGTSIAVWAIIALLFIGLTGLGLGGAVTGLASQNVAKVGDEPVSREEYVRTLLNQINTFSQQIGQPLTMSQARLFGLDQQVLGQLVTRAALDDKVHEMGLSVGDRIVAQQLLQARAFQGVTGGFDQQAYEFYLDRNGLSASEYEDRLRRDVARSMLELGVAAGTEMPPVVAGTILAHTGEERRFAYVALGPDTLESAPQVPGEDALRAHYDANPDSYTTEESRVVAYAALLPADMAETIEVSEAQLRAAYEAREQTYNRPEARVVDRLAFGTLEEAEQARAAIDASETTFGALVQERGLSAADVSLGPVEREDVGAAAREVLFGATEPGILGPVQTDLGPTLYRLNAIIAAEVRAFEEVQDELRGIVATEQSGEAVLDWIDPVADLVASGATVEEVANETPMILGEISLTPTPGDGLAGDLAFRREAFEAEPGEERDLIELDNGGIAILRVERIEEPKLRPYEEVAEQVAADWRAEQVQIALVDRAEAMQATLAEGRTFAAVAAAEGLDLVEVGPISRDIAARPGLPADSVSLVFGLEEGESTVVGDLGQVFLIQLLDVAPVDTGSEAYAAERDAVERQLNGSLATSVYLGFAQMLTDSAGVSVNQQLIDDTLAQYP